MGCDIHVCTEALHHIDSIPTWCNEDDWRINRYSGKNPEYEIRAIYSDRDYELFSHLANVRNYGDNRSFKFDRGIPVTASCATKKLHFDWGLDAHTPGWCTLKELKDAALECKTISRKGYVYKGDADRFREIGTTPSMWALSVSNEDEYEWFEWEEADHSFDELIEALEERKREVFYIYDLKKDDGRYDDQIRIVFWFDN